MWKALLGSDSVLGGSSHANVFPSCCPSVCAPAVAPSQHSSWLSVFLMLHPSIPPSPPLTRPGLGAHSSCWPQAPPQLSKKGQIHPNPRPAATTELRVGSGLGIPRAGIPKGFCFLSKGCSWCHANPPEWEGGQWTTAQLSWTWWPMGQGPAVLDVAVAFSLHSAQPVCLTKNASPMSHGLTLGTLA